MTFYFAWVKDPELFDATRHARQDESILHFDIDHQEGAVPLLRLTVASALHKPQKTGQRGLLWQQEGDQNHVLFDGTLVANPAEKKEDFLLLILEAGGRQKAQQLNDLLKAKKQKSFEPLLVAEKDLDAVDEGLEALSVLPHWDRVTGQLSCIDLGQVLETVELGSQFLADSLEIHERGRALAAVRFNVTAEWVQRYDGIVDLSPLIQEAGGRGYLSTLTPEDLQKRWWRKHYPLQRTGYEILESKLELVTPPSTGGLDVYPLKSASFTANGRTHTLPRAWLKPTLKLHWHYRQKRQETVRIEVPCGQGGEVLEINLRLQDICSAVRVNPWQSRHVYYTHGLVTHQGHVWRAKKIHFSEGEFDSTCWERQDHWPTALEDPSCWSFFQTDRGRQVIEHVMQRATAYGHRGGRWTEIRCRLPFAEGRQLRGNQQARLVDARLPGGDVTGAVVHYRLVVEGDTGDQWAEVTLAVRAYSFQPARFKRLRPLQKAEGILEPARLTAEEMVTSLRVNSSADEQNHALEGKTFPSLRAAQTAVERIPTRVRVELKDLKPMGTLAHSWVAEVE